MSDVLLAVEVQAGKGLLQVFKIDLGQVALIGHIAGITQGERQAALHLLGKDEELGLSRGDFDRDGASAAAGAGY